MSTFMKNKKMLSSQSGFLSLPNDNMAKTLIVATLLCLVCSIVVSFTAIQLKPKQTENKLLDKKINILTVAGLTDSSVPVDERFAQIQTKVVDLSTGALTDEVDPLTYDQRKASKDPQASIVLSGSQDVAQIKTRANYANVYLLEGESGVEKIILPVKGYGLWSIMYGFIALEGDASTVSGITFYEHGETPGLGGEIENARWLKSWEGKQVFKDDEVALGVIKGAVNPDTSEPEYKIDGLAGATLTSNGVSNMIKFWLGSDGFGPYLERFKQDNTEMSLRSFEASSALTQASVISAQKNKGI